MARKRIGYIGLSGPLFYDYRVSATKSKSDIQSSPNPILDAGFGLMLLFDELWFLCRSLCPQNMRHLPYVTFMDEAGLLPDLTDLETIEASEAIAFQETVSGHFASYREQMLRIGIHWDAAADNHTHELDVNGLRCNGNVTSSKSLLWDLAILKRVANPSLELVTNGVTDAALSAVGPFAKARLTELLIIEHVPNYLSRTGPYHPSIDEARENHFLRDYREWIATIPLSPSVGELREVKEAVEAALKESQRTHFLKYLKPANAYFVVAKSLGGLVVDALSGGALSAAYDLEKEREEERRRRALRYQGFILSARP